MEQVLLEEAREQAEVWAEVVEADWVEIVRVRGRAEIVSAQAVAQRRHTRQEHLVLS